MKKLIPAAAAIVAAFFSVSAYAGCGADKEIGEILRTETQSCTGAGYCYAWGVNPSTGQYEYGYFYQSSCPGTQSRTVADYQCRMPSGASYSTSDEGSWGFCQVQ